MVIHNMANKLRNLKWETVALDGFPSSVAENMHGFVALEECTQYGLEDNKIPKKKKLVKKKRKSKEAVETETTKKKIKLANGFIVENCDNITPSISNENTCNRSKLVEYPYPKKEKSKFGNKISDRTLIMGTKKLKLNVRQEETSIVTNLTPEDMLTWAEFKLPEEIIKALMELGFKKPTHIQQLILPAAIHGRRDILGAAETGSGKTLAFGLPILSGIMKLKDKAATKGLDVYDIPYKKTSIKRNLKRQSDTFQKQNSKKNVEINKVKENINKESSEDGYVSDEEDHVSDGELTEDSKGTGSNNDSDDYIEEIEVPIKKKTISGDEGNESDDSNEYVHLSELHDSDDYSDGENSCDEDVKTLNNEQETNEQEEGDEIEISENEEAIAKEGIGCVKVIEDIQLPGHVEIKTGKPLYALILTPTRELAIQISKHLTAVAKYTGIRIATIVGGMAGVKQERVLRYGPEVVVATPGRLWELISHGQPHLQQLSTVKFLAIDETDRMIERGHFEELQPLLERLNSDDSMRSSRQNFVMSATLTLVHDLPTHMKGKKVTKRGKIINRKINKMTPEMKIKKLVDMIGMTDTKVVDITAQNLGTAETLTECRIACSFDHKDAYLYYILKRHPGKTIVFCNSIGCVRRLTSLFAILKCKPLPLHAGMPQRQRLKNLERFAQDPHGVLVSTDVAARGLDVPDVHHVIHYQVPRTAENYVHRSGRTARASKEGLTILMMEPSEAYLYGKLCQTLNKTSELPTFPVAPAVLSPLKDLVKVGRQIEALELRKRRDAQAHGWRERAARDMDMIIDEDDIPVTQSDPTIDKVLKAKKNQLDKMLSRPIYPKGFSYKYPTLNDPLVLARPEDNALKVMKEAIESNRVKKEKRSSKNAPLLKLEKSLKKNLDKLK